MKQEKDILKGLRGKQEEAQRLLLQRYGGMVFSQVVRIVPSQEDAEEGYEEVAQEVGVECQSEDVEYHEYAESEHDVADVEGYDVGGEEQGECDGGCGCEGHDAHRHGVAAVYPYHADGEDYGKEEDGELSYGDGHGEEVVVAEFHAYDEVYDAGESAEE